MDYPIQDICKILGVKKTSSIKPYSISMLLTDSRKVFYPKESVFFALVTPNNDGHKFIIDLYKKGVRNFVVSQKYADWLEYDDANFIIVENTLDALQKLATYHRSQFDIPVIGITGSNGKTIVKEWLYHVLKNKFRITHSPRSYNSQIGVPLSVWQLDQKTELGIFEAGISLPEEMSKLEPMISPTIGIMTNIGQAHQEGFSSMKQKCMEKLELFIHTEAIICEEENKLIDECMEQACLSHKRLTWSKKGSPKSPLFIRKIKKEKTHTEISYLFLGFESKIDIPFTDDASIEDAIHVLAASLYLQMKPRELLVYMADLQPVSMRLDVREGKGNCFIINDSYNSDINSISIALDFLIQQATDKNKRKLLILSDIPQSGLPSKDLYKLAAELISKKGISEMIGIGPEIAKHKECFKRINIDLYDSTHDFLQSDRWYEGFQNRAILLKGARNFHFENINKALEVQTHATVLDIDLDAIVHNFNFYKSKLDKNTKIVCMIKANGYGAGAAEIAKTLQYHKCDYIAVAIAEEGVALRQAGINIPIIVLNAEVGGFEELAEYKLEPEVYNFRILNSYINEARILGLIHYPIHLKLDTGMHRLGFEEEDIDALIQRLDRQQGVRVQSIFSHLSASDESRFDDFTQTQFDKFERITDKLQNVRGRKIMRHILNSAGIERFPEHQCEMVRLGISLYGLSASGLNGLRNVCTLKTTILQIKDIKIGESVGYGCKGKFDKDAKIATIRIGYADGLSRKLGNGVGSVMIQGQEAPFVGNICMDLSMIDITNIPDAKEGGSVVIFNDCESINRLAEKTETIPYEILTSVSNRVKHIYYKE